MTFPGPVRHVGGDRDGDKNPRKQRRGMATRHTAPSPGQSLPLASALGTVGWHIQQSQASLRPAVGS